MSGDAWKEGGIDATGNTALINFIMKKCYLAVTLKSTTDLGICSAPNIDFRFGCCSSLISNLSTQESVVINV